MKLGRNKSSFEHYFTLRIYNKLISSKDKSLKGDTVDDMLKPLNQKMQALIHSNLRKLHVERDVKKNKFTYNSDLVKTTLSDSKVFNELLRPEYIDTKKDKIQVGSKFYSSITATGFPNLVENNWLSNLASEKNNVDFSMHVTPSSVSDMEIHLNKQLRQVENDLFVFKSKGVNNQSLENRKKELIEQLDAIIRGDYKLYKTGLFMIAKGNEEEVDLVGGNVKSRMLSEGIESETSLYEQENILKTVMPTAQNHANEKMIIVPSPALSASFPFSSSFYDVDEGQNKDDECEGVGTLLGFNDNNLPIAKSLWKLPKYIGCVIGSSGSGKSYSSKAFILNEQLINNTKFIIIDPEDEYYPMFFDRVKNKDGSYEYNKKKDSTIDAQMISLSINQKNLKDKIPNILDFGGVEFASKLALLPKIYRVFLGEINEVEKSILEKASIQAYNKKGIFIEKENTWSKQAPCIGDVYDCLVDTRKKSKDSEFAKVYDGLIVRLDRYVNGVFSFVNSKKKISCDSPITVINLHGMADEIRPLLMLIMLEFIRTTFSKDAKIAQDNDEDPEKKMVVLDEAWKVLKSRDEAEYIENFARTFRKINGGLLLITQSVSELKESPQGKAFLANSSFKYVLKTEQVVLNETCELFDLNNVEKEILSTALPGEGILIWDNIHHKINVKVDDITHDIITTNPNERSK